MQVKQAMSALTGMFVLVACNGEPPPRSVQYFVENRIVLDSVLTRCNANREATLDNPECANARKAVSRLAAQEEEDTRAKNDASFERQRAGIRQRQDREAARIRAREEAAATAATEALVGGNNVPGLSPPASTAGVEARTNPPPPLAQTAPPPPAQQLSTAVPAPPPETLVAPSTGVAPQQATQAAVPQPIPAAGPESSPPVVESGIESEIRRLEEELKRRREAATPTEANRSP